MSSSFAEEAQALTRGQLLLDLLLDVEDRLRLLIRSVFGQAREDWENLIPKSTRTELQGMKSSAAEAIGRDADLLDRATLKQLVDVFVNAG